MPDEQLKPRDAAEVEQAIRAALAGGKTLEVVGRGSKRAIGRAAQWDVRSKAAPHSSPRSSESHRPRRLGG